jgi:hypothetical protein
MNSRGQKIQSDGKVGTRYGHMNNGRLRADQPPSYQRIKRMNIASIFREIEGFLTYRQLHYYNKYIPYEE